MAYSADVVRRAQQRLAEMKSERETLQWRRLNHAYTQVPRIKEIDLLLRKNMSAAAQSIFTPGSDVQALMDNVKSTALTLQKERQELIQANFEPGYIDEGPICSKCGGAGYIGSTMCDCLKELCRQEQTKELSLLACGEGRFEDFRLDYYPEQFDPKFNSTVRTVMRKNFEYCKQFAENFGSGNLLFIGGTGLGKTFLSACIARAVAEKGYSVAYEPAGQLFSKLEKNRFNPDEESRQQAEKLTGCDLLIIDDLGTELPGNFVTAALYNLVNDRLLAGKPMVISTNLNINEIAQRYSPQIASRLNGDFMGLWFAGNDIRILKNRNQ